MNNLARALLVFGIVLGVACGEAAKTPTQVIVRIEAEREVERATAKLHLTVEDTDGNEVLDRRIEPDFPVKVALAPLDDDPRRKYKLTVEALNENGDEIARARIASGYVAGEKRFVVVVLEDACVGVLSCDGDSTCHDGDCVSALIDPEDLGTSSTDPPEAGDLVDGPPSATDDAATDDAATDDAATDDAATDDAGTCAIDNGGCDELVACKPQGCEPCPSGYDDVNEDGTQCEDIDECKTNNGDCGDDAFTRCIDKVGAAPDCADIDECSTDNGGCGGEQLVRCVDKSGMPPDCQDIDECDHDNGDCGDPTFVRCVNKTAAPPACEDIDECEDDNGGCDQTCLNQEGPNICACEAGDELQSDGRSCWTPKWGDAVLIETDDAGNAEKPQVAIDRSGNAVAVWLQSDGTHTTVSAKRFVNGVWGNTTRIDRGETGNARDPQVDMDAQGNAIAVWIQSEGTRDDVWANRFILNSGWGNARKIEADDAASAATAQIAVHAGGDAIAIWSQSNGTYYSIWACRFLIGSVWQPPVLVETDDMGDAMIPQIGIDDSGNALAVWAQYTNRWNVWANRFAVDSGWATPTRIQTDNVGNASAALPQVALEGSGNAFAVWSEYSSYVRADRFVAGSGWAGEGTLIRGPGDAYRPQIAVDRSGNALAIFTQWNFQTPRHIWFNRYVSGSGWGVAAPIDDAVDGFEPQLDMDDAGNAIAVWYSMDDTRYDIRASRYVVGTGWSVSTLIETDNAGHAQGPQIAVDPSGDAIAVWSQSDGTRFNIWANRFQ